MIEFSWTDMPCDFESRPPSLSSYDSRIEYPIPIVQFSKVAFFFSLTWMCNLMMMTYLCFYIYVLDWMRRTIFRVFILSERSYGSWIENLEWETEKKNYLYPWRCEIYLCSTKGATTKVTKITTKTQRSKMNFAHSIITHNIHLHLLLLFVVWCDWSFRRIHWLLRSPRSVFQRSGLKVTKNTTRNSKKKK